MKPSGTPLTRKEVMRGLRSTKDVQKEVEKLLDKGWSIYDGGHKYYAYCPCEGKGSRIRIDGTPRNESNHAKFIRREAAKCPERHEYAASGRR